MTIAGRKRFGIRAVAGIALLSGLPALLVPARAAAADPLAVLKRMHLGPVKAVDSTGSRLGAEGMVHDRPFREISVSLEPDAPIINPDVRNSTRVVGRGEIRAGYYVALDCSESGKRHAARKVMITGTGPAERFQPDLARGRRAAPPGFRGMGGSPR